jgi:hypothetical protein
MSKPVGVNDIEIIEEVVGGYDWLGTGSSYDHAGKRGGDGWPSSYALLSAGKEFLAQLKEDQP